MYISEIQRRIMQAVESKPKDLIMHFVCENGADENEMSDTYHIALWLEGAPKDVKEKFIDLANCLDDDCRLRVCSECGKFMTEGYLLCDGDWYACSEQCAVRLCQYRLGVDLTPEEAKRNLNYALDHDPEGNFWTEWVQEL